MATNIPIIPNIGKQPLRGNLKEAEEKAWNWSIPHNKPNYSSPAPSPAPSPTPSPPSSVVSKPPPFVVRNTYSPPDKKGKKKRSRRSRRTRKVRR